MTVVTVTAGKPSELAFKLSKFSALPAGKITFNVTNQGVAFHDFKICTAPVTSLAKNACLGKVTKILHSGDKATLTVTLTKSGKYEYLCTVSGHAAAGMKGLIGIGVSVAKSASVAPAPAQTTTTAATPTPTPSPTPTPAPAPTPAPVDQGGSSECPPGVTIQTSGHGDQDGDETGSPSDGDGCI